MVVRKVRYGEFETLMNVLNRSFGFERAEDKFEHILPKLYYPDNPSMVHIGAFEDGQLVSAIGLYPMELVFEGRSLRTACIGAVSTLPEFRGRGFFRNVMEATLNEARAMNIPLLFLGGDRLRYGRFGFENSGRTLNIHITKRSENLLTPDPFEVAEYDGTDREISGKLLEIYENEPMRMRRTAEELPTVLRSWNCKPYYVTRRSENSGVSASREIIGYFAIKGNHVSEIGFAGGNISRNFPDISRIDLKIFDTVLAAILSLTDSATVPLPMRFCTPEVLDRIADYTVSFNHMFNILDEKAVAAFLTSRPDDVLARIPAKADGKTRIRLLLGDCANDSITGNNLFISGANSG